MAEPRILIAQQGDKLDLMLWREMGLGPSHVSRVLRANVGLADLGAVLPIGKPVAVPATMPSDNAARIRPITQLWD